MNTQRKILITTTYNEMGIIIDTKAEEVAQLDLQSTCNQLATDCISRQMAIEAFEPTHYKDWYTPTIIETLETLPSVLPARKKGRWIPVTNGRGGFECDRCHCYAPSYQDGVEWLSAFCPNCGCRMEGESE